MRYGSVCSGIEAASVAWHPLGWQAAWLAEIEPFPSAVLAHHYPQTPNLGDMTKIAPRVLSGEVEAPDVLVGGTPCQAFSVAGMREGLNDPRGELTIKYVELANAVDDVRARAGKAPAIVVWENVPGVLSDKGNAFGCFLGALAGEDCALEPAGGKWTDAGCVYGPQRTIAWRILDAQYFGLAQRRRRVFLVASARADFDPCAVLFERDSVRRDTAPSREAGQNAARGFTAGPAGVGFADLAPTLDCRAKNGQVQNQIGMGVLEPIIMAHGQGGAEVRTDGGAPCLTCNHEAPIVVHGTQDPDTLRDLAHPLGRNQGQENAVFGIPGNWIGRKPENGGNAVESMHNIAPCLTGADRHGVATCVTGDITHTLRWEGADASEDGTGRGTPIVALSLALRGRDGGATAELGDDVAGCLRASSGGGDKPHVLTYATREVAQTITSNYGKQVDNSDTALGPNVAIVFDPNQITSPDNRSNPQAGAACHTLPAKHEPPVLAYRAPLPINTQIATRGGALGERTGLGVGDEGDPAFTLQAAHSHAVFAASQVRRLTPVECERLQGFPDGYTAIPWRGKDVDVCPDGPRYKALGNSKAVPVVRWIGRRIEMVLHAVC